MLARLLAVADDVDAGILLHFHCEQRGVELGLRASSSPDSCHCGHSLSGSASHDGFGRLPAMVGGNIMSRTLVDCETVRAAPTIEPIVAREQSFAAHQPHARFADEGLGAGQPDRCGPACATSCCARVVRSRRARFVFAQSCRPDRRRRAPSRSAEHRGVLDRHAGALRQKRQHRMGGVAEQRDRAFAAAEGRAALVQRPFQPALGQRDEVRARPRTRCQRAKCRSISSRLAGGAPARLIPFVADDARRC